MTTTLVDNAKYRRLRANGVPHRQALAMSALTPSADFATGGGLSSIPDSVATDDEVAAAIATLASTVATDSELAAAVATINTALSSKLAITQAATSYRAIDTITGLIPNDSTLATAQANSATLAAWAASTTRGNVFRLNTPGTYSFYGDMDLTNLTNPVRECEIGTGVTLQQTKNSGSSNAQSAYGIRFRGSVGNNKTLTADALRLSRTMVLSDVTGIVGESTTFGTAPGTLLWIYSDQFIDSQSKFKHCAIRRVVSVNTGTNTVTLDAPLFRDMTVAMGAAAKVITPHPSVRVKGFGTIKHATPGDCYNAFYNSLLRFDWVDGAYVDDVHITNGPGVGVDLINVMGGVVNAHVSYLPCNDSAPYESANTNSQPHYGYGVFAGGGTRNVKIGGTSHHVRHAFTTGNATDVYLSVGDSGRGDPEFIEVDIQTWDTYAQPIDTHEAGHDIEIFLNTTPGTWDDSVQQGKALACNIRTLNTKVHGEAFAGKDGGIQVTTTFLIDPTLGEIDLSNLRLTGGADTPSGLQLDTGVTKVRLSEVDIDGCPIGIRPNSGAVDISGRGVRINARGATPTAAIFISNAVTPGQINLRDVEFTGYPTEINYNSSTLTQAFTRLEKVNVGSGRMCIWTGSAWPTRPKVPAGEVTYRGPSTATNPTDALAGDILELG